MFVFIPICCRRVNVLNIPLGNEDARRGRPWQRAERSIWVPRALLRLLQAMLVSRPLPALYTRTYRTHTRN